MGVEFIFGLIASVGAGVATLGAAALFARLIRKRPTIDLLDVEVTSIEMKLEQLASFSSAAARLTNEIAIETEARVIQARQAKEEADVATEAAKLSEESKLAVAALLRQEMSAELRAVDKRQSRRAFWINLIYFVAGVAASVIVQLVVRPPV